jgi:nucleotide sugar dehydrogenase
MKIGVIGAGRLGICFALLCEAAGYDVLVSDIREDYVESINNKRIKTNEPEVLNLLRASENLRATTSNAEVIEECDLIYTLVATPSLDDGNYDVSAIWQVVEDFAFCEKTKYFVIGCTTNPGDCDRFKEKLPNNIKVLYNPEFIAQGSIVNDLRKADMVLLGYDQSDQYAERIVKDIKTLYQKIQTTRAIVCGMSTKAAEITKIALNCFLTTKISYANMLGDLLQQAGCGDEVTAVLRTIGTDSRVGSKYLGYGFGYGGPCLPRDNRAFGAYAQSLGLEYNLGVVTDEINNQHARFLRDWYIKMNPHNKPFFFESITYKRGTDILTESQQFRLAQDLLAWDKTVYILVDPRINSDVYGDLQKTFGDKVKFVDSKDNITEGVFVVNV